jgi:hypothetical protein
MPSKPKVWKERKRKGKEKGRGGEGRGRERRKQKKFPPVSHNHSEVEEPWPPRCIQEGTGQDNVVHTNTIMK